MIKFINTCISELTIHFLDHPETLFLLSALTELSFNPFYIVLFVFANIRRKLHVLNVF